MKIGLFNSFKKNENLQFLTLLVLTALVLYFIPFLKSLFFIITLYFFYKSKNNYFWLAYFFTVIMDVGGFFQELTYDVIEAGPLKISLVFLYAIVSFIKVKYKRIKTPFFLKRNVDVWILYLFILIYVGFFIIGNSGGGKSGYRYYVMTFNMLPVITVLYTTHKFIPDETALLKFSKLIFLTIIVNVIGQFLHLFLNEPVNTYFIEKEVVIQGPDYVEKDFTDELVRPVWGTISSLIAIFLALYWSVRKNNHFKNWYLMLFLALSIFSIFITATRGWIIAILIFIISSLFLMNLENKLRIIRLIFMVLVAFIFIYSIYEPVKIQTDQVFERLTTLEDLAKGDVTAGGTNLRLTDRNKPVMDLFYKRPIFGSGFSLEGLQTSDQHVGNQNILMSGGIIGYFIIVAMWINIIIKTFKVNRHNLSNKNYAGETLLIIPLLLCIFIIHSTSMSVFGYIAYVKYPDKLIFIGLVFAIMNQIIFNFQDKKKTE